MGKLISDKFAAWQEECEQRFQQLKANEEELNRIFIDIYGLQDELTPEVEDKDVTVRRADLDPRDQEPAFLCSGVPVRAVLAGCGWAGVCRRRMG